MQNTCRQITGLVLLVMSLVSAGLASADAGDAPHVELDTAGSDVTECVILVHGLARTSSSMQALATSLFAYGFGVVNVDYPSRKYTIETLADMAIPPGIDACRAMGAETLHAVTHSLGGILIRQYLAEHSIDGLGRVVMLAPPNQGSEVVDALRDMPGYSRLNGPAGQQLGTGDDSVPLALGPVVTDVAIVAGTRSINLFLSNYLPNPDDGKVSVASTRVEGMCAMLELDVSHPFIMQDEKAMSEVLAYLSEGRFVSTSAEYPECLFRF
ncbi:MAG: alpha/beta fold hydrolase [Granulosicoccus sp.]